MLQQLHREACLSHLCLARGPRVLRLHHLAVWHRPTSPPHDRAFRDLTWNSVASLADRYRTVVAAHSIHSRHDDGYDLDVRLHICDHRSRLDTGLAGRLACSHRHAAAGRYCSPAPYFSNVSSEITRLSPAAVAAERLQSSCKDYIHRWVRANTAVDYSSGWAHTDWHCSACASIDRDNCHPSCVCMCTGS